MTGLYSAWYGEHAASPEDPRLDPGPQRPRLRSVTLVGARAGLYMLVEGTISGK